LAGKISSERFVLIDNDLARRLILDLLCSRSGSATLLLSAVYIDYIRQENRHGP